MTRAYLLPILFATTLLVGCGSADEKTEVAPAAAAQTAPTTVQEDARGALLEAGGLQIRLEKERRADGPSTTATFSRDGKVVSIPCTLVASVDDSHKDALARVYCLRGTASGTITGVVDITKTADDVNMVVRYFGRAGDADAADFETIAGTAVGARFEQSAKLTVVSSQTPDADPLALVSRVGSVISPLVGKNVAPRYVRTEGSGPETISSVTAMVTTDMTLLLDVEFASDRTFLSTYTPKPIALVDGDSVLTQDALAARIDSELHVGE
jgi:hypothetical protein